MVWNIEKFTAAKFGAYLFKPPGVLTSRKRGRQSADQRIEYMRAAIDPGVAAYIPDVIAILEPQVDDVTAIGQPMSALNATGVLQFLDLIKDQTGNPAWRVVPPIKCNPSKPPAHAGSWAAREVVAVFYNSTTMTFEGPDYWTGAGGVVRPALGGAAAAAAYPPPWDTAAETLATTRAGRIAHTDALGATVLFPNDMNRRPFMVDFREKAPTLRLFRCLFIHTSPQHGLAGAHVTGSANIASIADMNPLMNTTAVPDYYIACGDFNVNDYYAAETTQAFQPLLNLQYRKALRQPNIRSTHFRRKHDANPLLIPFGYAQHQVIDNFLVRRTVPPQPSIATYFRAAVDRVRGGPAPWATSMDSTLATINGPRAGPDAPGPTAIFRRWENFWCIIATSDHMPTYLRIS
jgi:hypothetical protein